MATPRFELLLSADSPNATLYGEEIFFAACPIAALDIDLVISAAVPITTAYLELSSVTFARTPIAVAASAVASALTPAAKEAFPFDFASEPKAKD